MRTLLHMQLRHRYHLGCKEIIIIVSAIDTNGHMITTLALCSFDGPVTCVATVPRTPYILACSSAQMQMQMQMLKKSEVGGSAVFMLVPICRFTRTLFRLSSSAASCTANRRSILLLSSIRWSCMTSNIWPIISTYACFSFGLAQLQLLRISIQCGDTNFAFSFSVSPSPSVNHPTPHTCSLQLSKLQKSLPVAIIPLILIPHLQRKRHHCAVTAALRLDFTSLIPVAVIASRHNSQLTIRAV